VVGVITSPTGAVIRDILHRIRDRWPCRVIVWPVVVQGEQAAVQVAAAIEGFNRLEPGAPMPRPDILIVARGGGSVEDLWAFNDEALARAAAASAIPLISAVGHETDTTLIDFVSDRRAPTPTAAAEIATPVLAELKALTADLQRRMVRCAGRTLEERRTRLTSAERGLPRPADLLALASQRFDHASSRLGAGLERNVAVHRVELVRVAGRLSPHLLDRPRQLRAERLADVSARLRPAIDRFTHRAAERLASLEKLRQSLNPDGPLKRGFARIHHADGSLARTAAALAAGEAVRMVFLDGKRQAVVDGEPGAKAEPAPADQAPAKRGKGPKPPNPGQGDLF
jgi:exodeoxyribonuclease VII large subunit